MSSEFAVTEPSYMSEPSVRATVRRNLPIVLNLSAVGRRPTGLGVYSLHCARALIETFDVPVIAPAGLPLPQAQRIESPEEITLGAGRFAAVRRWAWSQRFEAPAGRVAYTPTHHGLPSAERQIITIHDTICLRQPHVNRLQTWFFRHVLPDRIRRSLAVFTVSESAKRDIVGEYGIDPAKVRVVPNCVVPTEFEHAPLDGREAFLLMVGASLPHKNVVEVLDNHACWFPRYTLKVICSNGGYAQAIRRRAAELGVPQAVEVFSYVDKAELVSLYRRCAALVYPSRWEGFGIPPLEALSSGAPVIVSDIPVHREVLGGAGIYVRLGEPRSWQEAFERLSDSFAVEAALRAGRERVAVYSFANLKAKLGAAISAVV